MNTTCSSCISNNNKSTGLYNLTDSTDPTIKGIQISGSQLIINYTGGSKPKPDPTSNVINTAGYWGSSGNANEYIPLIKDIDPMYNILILTFLNFTTDGDLLYCTNCNKTPNRCSPSIGLDIPCSRRYNFDGKSFTNNPVKNNNFYDDIQTFKNKTDPLKRKRYVMISIGGQNGLPFLKDQNLAYEYIKSFLTLYNLDGIDIDMESGGFGNIDSMKYVLSKLKSENYLISAVPEPTDTTIDPYNDIFEYLNWIWPQFYNNPPPGVTGKYYPPCYSGSGSIKSYQEEYNIVKKDPNDCTNCWPGGPTGPCLGASNVCSQKNSDGKCPTGSTLCPPVSNFKQCTSYESGKKTWPWWAGVVDKIVSMANNKGNNTIKRGITTLSCNNCGAGTSQGGNYDYSLLRNQIVNTKTEYVATWALAYDIKNNYTWIKTILGL